MPYNLPAHAVQPQRARHPDNIMAYLSAVHKGEVSDKVYLHHLQMYADWRGVDQTKKEPCSRPHLFDALKDI